MFSLIVINMERANKHTCSCFGFFTKKSQKKPEKYVEIGIGTNESRADFANQPDSHEPFTSLDFSLRSTQKLYTRFRIKPSSSTPSCKTPLMHKLASSVTPSQATSYRPSFNLRAMINSQQYIDEKAPLRENNLDKGSLNSEMIDNSRNGKELFMSNTQRLDSYPQSNQNIQNFFDYKPVLDEPKEAFSTEPTLTQNFKNIVNLNFEDFKKEDLDNQKLKKDNSDHIVQEINPKEDFSDSQAHKKENELELEKPAIVSRNEINYNLNPIETATHEPKKEILLGIPRLKEILENLPIVSELSIINESPLLKSPPKTEILKAPEQNIIPDKIFIPSTPVKNNDMIPVKEENTVIVHSSIDLSNINNSFYKPSDSIQSILPNNILLDSQDNPMRSVDVSNSIQEYPKPTKKIFSIKVSPIRPVGSIDDYSDILSILDRPIGLNKSKKDSLSDLFSKRKATKKLPSLKPITPHFLYKKKSAPQLKSRIKLLISNF